MAAPAERVGKKTSQSTYTAFDRMLKRASEVSGTVSVGG